MTPSRRCCPPGIAGHGINGDKVGYWQSGLYIEHVATGLFVYGAYGREFERRRALASTPSPIIGWSRPVCVSGGHPLGHTVLYGFYAQRHDMIDQFT